LTESLSFEAVLDQKQHAPLVAAPKAEVQLAITPKE